MGWLVYEWVTFSWKVGICMGPISNSQQHIPIKIKLELSPRTIICILPCSRHDQEQYTSIELAQFPVTVPGSSGVDRGGGGGMGDISPPIIDKGMAYVIIPPPPIWWKVKGALDKYNIYLFISQSIENSKLNQFTEIFSWFCNAFSFYEVFLERHHLQSVP